MKIIYSPNFLKKYKKLPKKIKELSEQKEKIFRKNVFDSRLKTHKLHGNLADLWAFSVDSKYRIIFEYNNLDVVIFHTIGDHDIYYN